MQKYQAHYLEVLFATAYKKVSIELVSSENRHPGSDKDNFP